MVRLAAGLTRPCPKQEYGHGYQPMILITTGFIPMTLIRAREPDWRTRAGTDFPAWEIAFHFFLRGEALLIL